MTRLSCDVVRQILVEDVLRRDPAPEVLVAVTAGRCEVVRCQQVRRCGGQIDRRPRTTPIRRLAYGAQNTVTRAGNRRRRRCERDRSRLDVEGEAETRHL